MNKYPGGRADEYVSKYVACQQPALKLGNNIKVSNEIGYRELKLP